MGADSRPIRAARTFARAATVAAGSWISACSGRETALGPTEAPTNGPANAVQQVTVSADRCSDPALIGFVSHA